jgi:GNAT superfamily N-acetyltransferase
VAATTIRQAEAGDDARLREITAVGKGHWGYDRARVADWVAGLDLGALDETWVAEADGRVVAWLGLLLGPSVCILDHLWVEPDSFGRGIGSELFRFGADRARGRGANWLQWESEPDATGFYEKLGAVQVGATLSSWGRELPVMQLDLSD